MFRKSHATIPAIQLIVVSQGQVELILDVGVKIVRVIVDHILDDIDAFSLLQVPNDRQNSFDHVKSSFRCVSPRRKFALLFAAVSEIGGFRSPAKHQDLRTAHDRLADQNIGRQVHLVVQSSIKLVSCRIIRKVAINNVSRNHTGAAKREANRWRTGGDLRFLREPPDFLGDVLRRFIEDSVALQDDPRIGKSVDDACNVLQCARAHKVIIAHEKAKPA